MKLKSYAVEKLRSCPMGAGLLEDSGYRTVIRAVLNLTVNLVYGVYNGVLGLMSHSLIFLVSALYYLLLSAMRFVAVLPVRASRPPKEKTVTRAVGIMLMILSPVFGLAIFISMSRNTAAVYGTIPMITIATYTFTKITMAVITGVKHRNGTSNAVRIINTIRYSEVAISLLTMQQSMLVSFDEGMAERDMVILNACTGAGVCLFIMFMGIVTVIDKRKGNFNMANSKFIKTNERIAEAVVGGYKKIEEGVVDGYRKIEKGVVDGYTKIEDKFIESYLTKEGETPEEAKARLKSENR